MNALSASTQPGRSCNSLAGGRGGYRCASQREFGQLRLDTAKPPACRTVLLVPGSCAHNPISASNFHGCATDDRKSLPASAAWELQAGAVSCQSRCAAIGPSVAM